MKHFILLSIVIILSFNLSAQTVVTFAGTPKQVGDASVAIDKNKAKFNLPYGFDIDSKGNILIAESGNHTITVIQASNNEAKIRVGSPGQSSFKDATGVTARFNGPRGLVIGLGDTIYVADYDNHVIRKITPFQNLGTNQIVTVFAGKYGITGDYYKPSPGFADGKGKAAQFQQPTDLDVDNSGNIYVADQGNHCIRKITPDGTVSTIAGVPNSPGFKDGNANEAQFNTPTGLFVVGNDIYVADRLNSRIRKISNGIVSTVVDGLWTPDDVIIIDGVYYIADLHCIKKYSNGTLSVFAGNSATNGSGFENGTGTTAVFNNIKTLKAFNGTEILLADQTNHILRRIMDCSYFKPTITVTGNTLTSTYGVSYQWYKDDVEITAATNQSITATIEGNYSVLVTDSNGCQALSAKFHFIPSNIETLKNNSKISISPNPFTTTFKLEMTFPKISNVEVKVISISGKTLIDERFDNIEKLNRRFEMEKFESGFYFVQIQNENSVKNYKVLKL